MVELDYTKFKPRQGKLLLSEPFMNDPNFKRTVILLASHNEEGSVGFVLNRPMELRLEQIIEDFPNSELPIWDGGPVQRDSLFYIHTLGDVVPDSIPIAGGLFWNGNFETIKALITDLSREAEKLGLRLGWSHP